MLVFISTLLLFLQNQTKPEKEKSTPTPCAIKLSFYESAVLFIVSPAGIVTRGRAVPIDENI